MKFIKIPESENDDPDIEADAMSAATMQKLATLTDQGQDPVLVPGLVARQGVTLFYGKWHSHKTYFTTFLAQCWSAGIDVPKFTIEEKVKILYLQYELPRDIFIERFNAIRKKLKLKHKDLKHILLSRYQFNLYERRDAEKIVTKNSNVIQTQQYINDGWLLMEFIKNTGADIVIVDSLKSYARSALDIGPVLRSFMRVASQLNVAFWIVHHENEGKWDAVYGGNIRNYPIAIIQAKGWKAKDDSNERGIRLTFTKTTKKFIEPISFTHKPGHLFLEQKYVTPKKRKEAKKLTKKEQLKSIINEKLRLGLSADDILKGFPEKDRNYAGKIIRGVR